MRNLVDVINQIIAIAPDLEIPLRGSQHRLTFNAPEMSGDEWNQVAATLRMFCGRDHSKFEEVQRIFNKPN